MDQEEKKAFMLFQSLIFHYHGLDEDEEKIMKATAEELDANEGNGLGQRIHLGRLHVRL